MEIKPGSRWRSAVSEAEAVVVRPPTAPGVLECGGRPMLPPSDPRPAGLPATPPAGESLLGKRYLDADSGLEVLCVKSGAGEFAVSGRPMVARDAKKLPASD